MDWFVKARYARARRQPCFKKGAQGVYRKLYRRTQKRQVSSDRSIAEIRKAGERYGATGFMFGTSDGTSVIAFQLQNRAIRIRVQSPRLEDFRLTPKGSERNATAMRNECEKTSRQRWRAIAAVIKAKLEAIENKVSSLDDEFLAHVLVDDKYTVAEALRDGIAKVYFGDNASRLFLPMLGAMPDVKRDQEVDDARFRNLG